MSILDILFTTLIMPLQLVFEVLYMLTNNIIDDPGMSIVALSLMMNFLILPLYMRADAMQEEERVMEARLRKGATHIRKTFKGDEKTMMLQTYYRQNHYKPTDVFKGSISLFLEIPFFISAYLFLSHLQLIQGVPFGVIADLGSPDGLLDVGGFSINVLPFIMTAVNLVSCIIFTKGSPTKTKVQLYGMALFFLVFLYNSPAGLVFYWTLNNVFALVKTVFYKLKNPARVLKVLFALVGAALLAYGLLFYRDDTLWKPAVVYGLGIVCLAPALLSLVRSRLKVSVKLPAFTSSKKVFVSGALFLTVMTGCVIPSSVIRSSPQEFIDITYYLDPIWCVVSSLCLAVGTFLVWMSVFYWLTSKKYKALFDLGVWIACGVAVLNYMFFGNNLGILSNTLRYESGLAFGRMDMLVNLACVALVALALFLVYRYGKKFVPSILSVAVVAFMGMSVYNAVGIGESVAVAQPAVQQAQGERPSFTLSRTGQNVVVLMLDRAMGEYIPYIMNERPELKDVYSGFTYYSNVVSFGGFTNFGTPGLFGGYEYTPEEFNKRADEAMVDKHNESIKVMPVLFDKNGFDVTVCDPSYAGYQWKPDLSIYDEYPDIKKYITLGVFSDKDEVAARVQSNKRNFFCFALVKTMPLFLQKTFYNDGSYNQSKTTAAATTGNQIVSENALVADGMNKSFTDAYSVLQNMNSMTNITDDSTNTFLMMTNDTTHEPMLLQEPEYLPADHVDNTEYEAAHHDRFTLDGVTLTVENEAQYIHYQTDVAALVEVGKWLDYLKKNGVYDNTRIIIVADHGRPLHQLPGFELDDGSNDLYDTEFYYPLLMIKDFNAKEFSTSEEFMTNADVPTYAVKDVIPNPINPFTGKLIGNDEKYAHDQRIFSSLEWDISTNNGNTYLPGIWLSVHDDMRVASNWTEIADPNAS